jgi:hypothetical protein
MSDFGISNNFKIKTPELLGPGLGNLWCFNNYLLHIYQVEFYFHKVNTTHFHACIFKC